MSEWRADGRTLWRDGQLVGMVDSPEIAAEIVAAMNRVTLTMPIVVTVCSCARIDIGSTYHEYVPGPRDPDCPFHGKDAG